MKLRLIVGLVATALTMLAADINGKWTATMPGRDGATREVAYTFKTDGGTTTGTYAGRQGERPVENLKVDGDTISWTQTMGERSVAYAGKVEGDEMKMKVKMGEQDRDVVFKRAK